MSDHHRAGAASTEPQCQTWGYYSGRQCAEPEGHNGRHRTEPAVGRFSARAGAASTEATLPTVMLVETHGESDDVVAEWPLSGRVVVTRDKVQIDGATAERPDLRFEGYIDEFGDERQAVVDSTARVASRTGAALERLMTVISERTTIEPRHRPAIRASLRAYRRAIEAEARQQVVEQIRGRIEHLIVVERMRAVDAVGLALDEAGEAHRGD